MKPFLSALIIVALTACVPGEPPAGAADDGSDSTMVVGSSAEVPSDERPVVVFLGTSLTAGLGLERESDGYVAQLSEMADSAGKAFRAVNAGVSGETSAGGLRRLDWVLREPLDVLVVELGANDGLRGQDPMALATNLSTIIQRARTRYPDVVVILAGMEAPPNLGERYTGAFRQVFPAVADAEQVALIPFLLAGVAGVPELNQDDRIHPTPEGHRMVAENAWTVLGPVLDRVGEVSR